MVTLLSPDIRRVMSAALLAALVMAGANGPSSAKATPASCAALQEKYPDWKGKTLVNAINPHTPGYESIDPKDPTKYVGYDIDLGEAIGDCLGFKLSYKAVTFAALLTTLSSGQADIVISDIYATEERAKAADFITYSKVFDGVLVEGKSEKDQRHQYLAVRRVNSAARISLRGMYASRSKRCAARSVRLDTVGSKVTSWKIFAVPQPRSSIPKANWYRFSPSLDRTAAMRAVKMPPLSPWPPPLPKCRASYVLVRVPQA